MFSQIRKLTRILSTKQVLSLQVTRARELSKLTWHFKKPRDKSSHPLLLSKVSQIKTRQVQVAKKGQRGCTLICLAGSCPKNNLTLRLMRTYMASASNHWVIQKEVNRGRGHEILQLTIIPCRRQVRLVTRTTSLRAWAASNSRWVSPLTKQSLAKGWKRK